MVKFLATCALVEDRAAQIYQAMAAAAQAEGNDELGQLWMEMAADEEDHAQQVRLAARLSREHVFEPIKAADREAPVVLLERAEALLQHVTSDRLSELEMLRVGVELEKLFRRVHTTYTLLFQDTSMKTMFDKLARGDEKHLEGLRNCIRRFGGAQPLGA